jgi:hypothetical protein
MLLDKGVAVKTQSVQGLIVLEGVQNCWERAL